MRRIKIVLILGALMVLPGCSRKAQTTELANGLIITDQVIGEGEAADAMDILTVKYVGKLKDGTIFDQSRQPFDFTLGAGWMIEGWEQGLEGMKVGGKRDLVVPPALGYGAEGFGDKIPPEATLYFTIELIRLEKF
ncbi:MAG: FKBP-type peptidyl-prolyl cis-trans isomerase [Fidelibacterota bacterium]